MKFILFTMLFVSGTYAQASEFCPENSVDGCSGKPVGAGCLENTRRVGSCELTPLTAGGFCMCYSFTTLSEDFEDDEKGAICCSATTAPNPTNCVPGC